LLPDISGLAITLAASSAQMSLFVHMAAFCVAVPAVRIDICISMSIPACGGCFLAE
jgi:hypothetical protein